MRKKTHEEFEREFYVVHPKAKLIGTYINNRTRIEWICENGHTRFTTPANIKQGYGCARCSGMEVTHEDFEEKFYRLLPKAKLVGQYTTNTTKIEWICENGHTRFTTPAGISQGNACFICSMNKRLGDKQNLYYIQLYKNDIFYKRKIGITSRSIKERFKKLPKDMSYKVLRNFETTTENAVSIEQYILNNLTEHKSYGRLLVGNAGGATECYTEKLKVTTVNKLIRDGVPMMSYDEIMKVLRYDKSA